MSLKKQTLLGIFWSLVQKVGSRGISFIVIIILARLLSPKEFGVIGLISIFIQVSQVLINGSFNQALIQKENADEKDFSSVFYVNLALSILLYFIIFFSAPYISIFYSQPILTSVLRILSLIFLINAFSYVQEAKLTKEMKFKKLFVIQMPSNIISAIISLILAYYKFGVWSLVMLQLSNRLIFAIQIWIYSKWKPTWDFDFQSVKHLFKYGGNLMISTIIRRVYENIYMVVLGKFYPITVVGYYQNAFNLVQYPVTTFTNAINMVTFSALSKLQNNDKGLSNSYKKIIGNLFLFICPVFIFLGFIAKPLFMIVFTKKWLPAVPYFQILCVVGIFYPLNAFNLSIVNIKGRSDIYLKLEIIKKVITTIGIVVSLKFGIMVILYFQAISSIIEYLINSYVATSFISYSFKDELWDVAKIVSLNILALLILILFNKYVIIIPNILFIIVNFFLWIGIQFFVLMILGIKLKSFSNFKLA